MYMISEQGKSLEWQESEDPLDILDGLIKQQEFYEQSKNLAEAFNQVTAASALLECARYLAPFISDLTSSGELRKQMEYIKEGGEIGRRILEEEKRGPDSSVGLDRYYALVRWMIKVLRDAKRPIPDMTEPLRKLYENIQKHLPYVDPVSLPEDLRTMFVTAGAKMPHQVFEAETRRRAEKPAQTQE